MTAGQVPVVAGFQGIGPDNRVTTLGRGGSDTSAVALAAALRADRCDIYTDVDGVYTTDPRIVAKARKLAKITYEEMLELASVGAKVLQTRSVELAMKERVRVQVLSSFADDPARQRPARHTGGGRGRNRGKGNRRRHRVFARRGEGHGAPGAGPARHRGGDLRPLAERRINVDMIVQNISADGTTDMTFTVGRDRPAARAQDARRPSRRDRLCGNRRRPRRGQDQRRRASACAAMPASPTPCSARWPTRGSTSR